MSNQNQNSISRAQHEQAPEPAASASPTGSQAADPVAQTSGGSVGGFHSDTNMNQSWSVEAPTQAEAWALCQGVGWYDASELERRSSLADEIAALTARKQQLADEINAAVAAGRNEGRSEAMREFAPFLVEVAARYETKVDALTKAATNAALALASTLVSELSVADYGASRAADRITDAISRQSTSDSEIGVLSTGLIRARCAPSERAQLQAQLPQIQFVDDATLSAGDAVVELSDGQIDLRVPTLVSAMGTAIAEHLTGESGT